MDNFFMNEFEMRRESNKISLDTFTFDKYNNLDYSLKKIIEDLRSKLNESYAEHKKWWEIHDEQPKKFRELEEIANQTGHSLFTQMHEYIDDANYYEEELYVLFEVKIIYAFKHFEINLKKLLSASYNDKAVGKRYKWENLIEYLKAKDINVKSLEGYDEVDQLRRVNNSLKHSNDFDDSISNIVEFKQKKPSSYRELEKFYNRVKDSPNIFLKKLCGEIYKDLYDFNENKIEVIAKQIALRMDKETANKLSEYLKKLY